MTATTAMDGRHRNNGRVDVDRVNDLLAAAGEPDEAPIDRPRRTAPQRTAQPTTEPAVSYRRISCAELDAATYDLEYLIDGCLVARQPCILAGSKKTLKTIDFGSRLATHSPAVLHASVPPSSAPARPS